MKYILILLFCVSTAYGQKIKEKVNRKPDKTYFINANAQYPLPNIKKVTELNNKSFRKEFKGEKDIRLWVGGYSLLLHKVEIPEMVIRTQNGLVNHKTKLKFYEGIIEGDEGSIVSVLFKNNRPQGYISKKGQNLTISEIDSITLLYDEGDFIEKPKFECEQREVRKSGGTQSLTGETFNPNLIDPDVSGKCITNYWEVDYPVFVNKGTLEATIDFAQGNFLQVATLYKNVGINLKLIELKVWTVPSPYSGTSGQKLTQFYTHLNGKSPGNLSHLLSFGGGGIAYVNSFALCPYFGSINGVNSSTGYSGIGTLYYVVPAVSWNINVLAHEIGHNLGSNHSHDCVWNGNNTPIDGCGPQAGYPVTGCAKGPIPAKGVIMSYCHLVAGVGVSFAEDFTGDSGGFGKQGVSRMKQCIQVGINCTVSCTVIPPPPCYDTIQTKFIPCPTGTTGQVRQWRQYSCSAKLWSQWATIDSPCVKKCDTIKEIGFINCPGGKQSYTLEKICGVAGDTLKGECIKTIQDTTFVFISCTMLQAINLNGTPKYIKIIPSGYTNYKYTWYKNGVLQGWKSQIVYANGYQYKKGDLIKCVVSSTNLRTLTKWWKPGECAVIAK